MMKNITEHIRKRRSVRTYNGKTLDTDTKQKLAGFMETIENPFQIPVAYKFLEAKEHGLTCPVVTGTELFVGGKIENVPNASVAFGYSFETLILYAQSIGVGTVWLGGTMNREAFEAAMELGENEIMPCASTLGYTVAKMSFRESMMRKAIKADERLPFGQLFFDGDFGTPLTTQKAGKIAELLEMVRLAPSAVNKQPWRVVIIDNTAHFYLKRSKGFGANAKLDMQMIDMGIALCHFALTAKESNMEVTFEKQDPMLASALGMEYVASYQF